MADTPRDPAPSLVYSAVYTSMETSPFTDDDLQRLLVDSREHNERAAITGVLLYRRGRFVQYLEGEEQSVRELLDRISEDPRHRGVRVLVDDPRTVRHFPHWTMGYVPESSDVGPLPVGFRVAFNDLDAIDEKADAAALRAVRELSLWFRGAVR